MPELIQLGLGDIEWASKQLDRDREAQEEASTNQVIGAANYGTVLPTSFTGMAQDALFVPPEMHLSAVYGCVKVIAEDVSRQLLQVMQEDEDRNISQARRHPIWDLLRWEPNRHMSPADFLCCLTAQALLYGTGYILIDRNGRDDRPTSLYPMDPIWDVTHVHFPSRGRNPVYMIRDYVPDQVGYGEPVERSHHDVIRVPFFTLNGRLGMPTVMAAADTIGLATAANQYATDWFEGGGDPDILRWTGDKEMKREQRTRIKQRWAAREIKREPKVITKGLELVNNPKSSGNSEAQMHETRGYELWEICRFLRVPPNKVMDFSQSNYNTQEAAHRDYLEGAIGPINTRLEYKLTLQALNNLDRAQGYQVKVDDTPLLSADMAKQGNMLAQMLEKGVFNINELRRKFKFNSIGELGEQHHIQLNKAPLGSPAVSGQV